MRVQLVFISFKKKIMNKSIYYYFLSSPTILKILFTRTFNEISF